MLDALRLRFPNVCVMFTLADFATDQKRREAWNKNQKSRPLSISGQERSKNVTPGAFTPEFLRRGSSGIHSPHRPRMLGRNMVLTASVPSPNRRYLRLHARTECLAVGKNSLARGFRFLTATNVQHRSEYTWIRLQFLLVHHAEDHETKKDAFV